MADLRVVAGPAPLLLFHGNGEDIIDIIVRHPATAKFVAKEIYAFFVSDDPDESAINEIAEVYTDSEYVISEVLQFVFNQNFFKESPDLQEEVLNYIAKNSNSNIRELIGIFNRVVAFGKMSKKPLNVNDCKIILRDVYNSNKVISIDKIQTVTSNFFSISLSDMLSPRRSRPLARPRQIAMYFAKKLTTRSLPEIGRKFANRDHTTVIHAVKTVEKLLQNNDEIKKNVEELKSLILSDTNAISN